MKKTINASICLTDLMDVVINNESKALKKSEKNNKEYISLSIYVNDTLDQFGNNVNIRLYSPEESERVYIGNGRTR